MRLFFLTFLALPAIALATWPEAKRTLHPPKTEDVIAVANNALSFYSTDNVRYLITKEQILDFLRRGKVLPYDSDRQKLDALASMNPPPNLTDGERTIIERWRHYDRDFAATTRIYAVADGTIATHDGHIISWRLENDKILYLATEDEACYLLIDK